MITIGFEVVLFHKKHKEGVELFVFIYDAQQMAGILLSKDLGSDEHDEALLRVSGKPGECAPIGHI